MQEPVKIFVEGVADVKFLSDYISYLNPNFEKINKESIIDSSGWTNNRETSKIQMQQNTDNGGVNLVIFDADDNFENRKRELSEWGQSNGLLFEIFLFPNNQDTGALEDLLEKIVADKNKTIFDCWNKYEICLRTKHIEGREKPLTIPAKKTKIYGYLEALLGATNKEKEKIKEKKRDYKNSEYWNLDSEELNVLKDFLIHNIGIEQDCENK